MDKDLKSRGIRRFALTLFALALLLFVPAGSLQFWPAWVFLLMMATLWGYFFIDLQRHDPQLLERRLRSKEAERPQRILLKVFSALLYVGFIVAGLDFRFAWSRHTFGAMPTVLIAAGQLTVALGYWLVFWVMKTNSFAGSTIQIDEGQRVIETGPYAWVRHPMYLGMAITAVAIPIALGSYVAIPAFVLIVPVLVLRLKYEEQTLHRELAGYTTYCVRTPFRLVPWVW